MSIRTRIERLQISVWRFLHPSERTQKVLYRGFTLVESLVAIWFLTLAIVAPMSLASQSLNSAYYSRDQIVAFQLAQEGIESVRQIRDDNTLSKIYNGCPDDVFSGDPACPGSLSIPINQSFIIDTIHNWTYTDFSGAGCTGGNPPPVRVDSTGTFYGYGTDPGNTKMANVCATPGGWGPTNFTRKLTAQVISCNDGTPASPCAVGSHDELLITVTVTWSTSGVAHTLVIAEDLYNWERL